MTDGPVVVVTGATSGIGRATVELLTAKSYRVAALARRAGDVDWGSDQVRGYRCDLTDEAEVTGVAESVVADHGRVDGLVNNAGGARMAPASSTDATIADYHYRVNVLGTMATCRAFVPALLENKGSVVNVSSATVARPLSVYGAYTASKAAVEAYSAALAQELAPQGVRVNVVRSGLVRTNIHLAGGMPAEDYEPFLAMIAPQIPLGRIGEPEEVATVIHFLLSDGARYMTGATVTVDGGETVGR